MCFQSKGDQDERAVAQRNTTQLKLPPRLTEKADGIALLLELICVFHGVSRFIDRI